MRLHLVAVLIVEGMLLHSVTLAQSSDTSAVLPISTKSAKARHLLDKAWVLLADKVEQAEAIEALHKSLKADSNFALAHEILAQTSLDPAEQIREQARASATKAHCSPAERTLIEWFQDAADHNLISAITNMNEVLKQYPRDHWVVYLANNWLTLQTQYERAAAVYEESSITNSPGLMNNLAYTYAYMREFDKAFAAMDKYVAALPNEANPQDSYAELLRMAGHFDDAITHYEAALAINPDFYASAFGIADTYSLMGDQEHARQAYEAAFHRFSLPELHHVQWKTREAVTYVRDHNWEHADVAFQAIAEYAHARRMTQVEADAYRQMSLYQRSPKRALLFVRKAETALREPGNVSATNLQQAAASVLRARVEVNIKAGEYKSAEAALAQLTQLAENSDDTLIENSYQGATGALMFAQHKYKSAITHLESDKHDPRSLNLLRESYTKERESEAARSVTDVLLNFNDATLEQALVVPELRKCFDGRSCGTLVKAASFQK
jgi:tetratricopeptide (TPR) repeat protein